MLHARLTDAPPTIRKDDVSVWGKRLFWLTLCLSLVINTGWLGLIDAQYRLATAHWLWTGAPPVDEQDKSPFVLTGVDGTRHSWYGLGQSLLMLPGDVVATLTIKATGLDASPEKSRRLHEFIVVILTFPLLAAAAAYALYALLLRLGLASTEAFLSVLVAVFATRLLNIMQIHQEDIHHLLFLTGATYWLFRWLDDKRGLFLGLAAACFGFNLLTRLTTGMDVIVMTTAIAVLLIREHKNWRDEIRSRVTQVLLIFAPVLLLFLLTDRLFHYYRFGEWTSTYLGLIAKKFLSENPGWPANWPWTYPFWKGFLEAFYSPLWGVIYFDPLFVVSVVLFALGWKEIPLRLKVMALAAGVLWVSYAAFYARYYCPPGWTAWGNRYLSVPTILLSALALPAWFKLRWRASKVKLVAFAAVLVWSIAIQLSSIVIHPNKEMIQSGGFNLIFQHDQRKAPTHYVPIIFRRFENIVTMIREGIVDSEFRPQFLGVNGVYFQSGGAYIFPLYIRRAVPIAWALTFAGLLILIIRFSQQASAQRSVR